MSSGLPTRQWPLGPSHKRGQIHCLEGHLYGISNIFCLWSINLFPLSLPHIPYNNSQPLQSPFNKQLFITCLLYAGCWGRGENPDTEPPLKIYRAMGKSGAVRWVHVATILLTPAKLGACRTLQGIHPFTHPPERGFTECLCLVCLCSAMQRREKTSSVSGLQQNG